MFYLIAISQTIIVTPDTLGPELDSYIKNKLYAQIEGTCNPKYGFIVAITSVDEIGEGFINDDADVIFTVKFKALIHKPVKGEVQDGIVTKVDRLGIHLQVGTLKVFIASQRIPSDMKFYDQESTYKSEDGLQILKKDSIVRFRIIGDTIKGNEMNAIATIADDYLGVIKRT